MSHLFEPIQETAEQARFFFDGIDTWDVSNVKDMSYMFCFAKNFNENINNWNVSKVTTMRGMFQFAQSFNQNLDKWDVSNVTNMSSMFYDAAAFNQNLDNWNIKNVKTMRFMFMYARYFEHKPNWDMSNVEDDVGMYYGSPIVYCDPDKAMGVDVELEKLSELESLQIQMSLSQKDDEIAKIAQNIDKIAKKVSQKVAINTNLKEKSPSKTNDNNPPLQEYDCKEQLSSSKVQSNDTGVNQKESDLLRVKALYDNAQLKEDEYQILVEYLKNK